MLTIYEARSGALEPHKNPRRITEQTIWIDLLNPKREEEKKVERALKLEVPTREEQREIEASSRLYQENGAHFMTATVLYQTETAEPVDHADHLHPRRQQAHHAPLRRAARLLDLRRALPQAGPKPHQRHGGADRADRDHRRSHGGFHRAHPGRGRHAVAFDLRDEGRHRLAAAPLRRDC